MGWSEQALFSIPYPVVSSSFPAPAGMLSLVPDRSSLPYPMSYPAGLPGCGFQAHGRTLRWARVHEGMFAVGSCRLVLRSLSAHTFHASTFCCTGLPQVAGAVCRASGMVGQPYELSDHLQVLNCVICQ